MTKQVNLPSWFKSDDEPTMCVYVRKLEDLLEAYNAALNDVLANLDETIELDRFSPMGTYTGQTQLTIGDCRRAKWKAIEGVAKDESI